MPRGNSILCTPPNHVKPRFQRTSQDIPITGDFTLASLGVDRGVSG